MTERNPNRQIKTIGSLEELGEHYFGTIPTDENVEQESADKNGGQENPRNGRNKRGKPHNRGAAVQGKSEYYEPYTFVEINDRVQQAYEKWQDVPDAQEISKERLSGTVSYRLEVKTPLLLGTDVQNDCCIPASTLRGLIRSNTQILGYSSVARDIEDRSPFFRRLHPSNVRYASNTQRHVSNSLQAYYVNRIKSGTGSRFDARGGYRRSRSLGDRVSGGIIAYDSETKTFYITKTKFHAINLRTVGKMGIRNFHVTYPRIGNIFEAFTTRQTSRIGGKRFRIPFFKAVTFSSDYSGAITAISDTTPLEREGYILSSGYIINSYTVYLFEKPSLKIRPIVLSEESVRNYRRENGSKDPFYQLPKPGEEKPVFFLLESGGISFGFTKLFPLPLEESTLKRLPKGQVIGGIDYDQALFGMEGKESGGRLVFEDAVLSEEQKREQCVLRIQVPELSVPKLQSVENYFDCSIKTDISHAPLMGIKQYWLRIAPDKVSQELCKNAFAIASKTVFFGKIRFYNLSKQELGLLLWSIELNSNSEQSLGNHRAYGYGRVKLRVNALQACSTEEFYRSFPLFSAPKGKDTRKSYYIKAYQKKLDVFLRGQLDKDKRLQEFFLTRQSPSFAESKIASYANWKIERMQRSLRHVRDAAEKYQWVVVEAAQLEEMLKPLDWNALIHHTPEDIAAHPFFSMLLERYRFLEQRMRLYENNQEYLIRRDILEDVTDFCERAPKDWEKMWRDVAIEELPYQEIGELQERCVEKLRRLESAFSAIATAFPKTSKPVLSVKGYVRDEGSMSYWLELENQVFCAPALILRLRLRDNQKGMSIFTIEEPKYLSGGAKLPVTLPAAIFPESGVQGAGDRYQVEIEFTSPADVFLSQEAMPRRFSDNFVLQLVFEKDGHAFSWEKLENPYALWKSAAEVEQRDMFFGRERIVQKIVAKAAMLGNDEFTGQSVVIYGQFRAGKSSILRYIKEELIKQPRFYVINAGQLASGQDCFSFIKFLFRGIKNSFRGVGSRFCDNETVLQRIRQCRGLEQPSISREMPDAEIIERFEQYMDEFSAIIQPKSRIILLIDEFSRLYLDIQRASIPDTIMQFWKSFIQRHRICSILVGADSMRDFVEQFPNEFGTADFFHVTYLDKPSARALICQPFQTHNHYNGFTEEAVELMWDLTAGSAYYLMMFCADIVDYLNERQWEREVNASFVRRFLDDIWFKAGNPSEFEWSRFHPLYRDEGNPNAEEDNIQILLAIARGAGEDGWCGFDALYAQTEERVEDLESKIDRLDSRDVIYVEQHKRVKIKVQLFAKALICRFGRD